MDLDQNLKRVKSTIQCLVFNHRNRDECDHTNAITIKGLDVDAWYQFLCHSHRGVGTGIVG